MSVGGSRRGIQRGTEMQSCGIGLLGLLVSLYEVVQNSANRGFFPDHRPSTSGKSFYLRCFAPLCEQKPRGV